MSRAGGSWRLFLAAIWVLVALAGCGGSGPEGTPQAPGSRATPPGQIHESKAVRAVWPTPNDAFARGLGPEAYVQPAASGRVESGLHGSTRNGGRRFHEGLDLGPTAWDARGEPMDEVRAALAGVVRHVNNRAGASSYGLYVVLEHPAETPAVYTLYAHLAEVAPGIAPGVELALGSALGRMGRSAGGYTIPRERAHVHFEIGLRLSDEFEAWYADRGFGNINEHGLWNGMNLAGLDPLLFFQRLKDRPLPALADWLDELPTALVVRVHHAVEPDFVRRYPALVRAGPGDVERESGRRYAWEVEFGVSAVPLRWRRVPGDPARRNGDLEWVRHDEALVASQPAKEFVQPDKAGRARVGEAVETVLYQIFYKVGSTNRSAHKY